MRNFERGWFSSSSIFIFLSLDINVLSDVGLLKGVLGGVGIFVGSTTGADGVFESNELFLVLGLGERW